jgi:hypothetical protein
VANIGNNNKSNVNNGDVLGVLIQKIGGSKPDGGSSKDITTTINATQNVGNAAGQAAVGKGSKPNQNNNQTFISQ